MGVPFDKGEALDRIAKACMENDFDAARLGWLRLTEAETNASYGQFAKQLIPVLLQLREVKEERAHEEAVVMEATASMEHNLGLIISQAEIEQKDTARLSTRLALAELALMEMANTVKALRARIRALEGR